MIISPGDKQVKLGPGQIQPKGYRLSSMRYGELKLGFIMNKGMFEVEVSKAVVDKEKNWLLDNKQQYYLS